MGAWGKAGGADQVTMLADGNGDFAQAVGLTMDGKAFGMGTRGQRYSMIVNDGVVEQPNVEAPGAFKGSSAAPVLAPPGSPEKHPLLIGGAPRGSGTAKRGARGHEYE